MLLAQMQAALGSLDRVERIVKLGVFVNSAGDFTDQPKVANGASELMEQVFGEAGRHARSAVGVPVLPLGAAVEIDAIVADQGWLRLDRALIARPVRASRAARRRASSRIAAPPSRRRSPPATASSSTSRPAATARRMVFHDYELDRLTEGAGPICGMVAAELERDPPARRRARRSRRLREVLALIAGRAPLLIEVKSPGRRVAALSRAVLARSDGYIGPVAVMSFNPEVGRWFARHAPEVLRGLVVTEAGQAAGAAG